MLWLQKYIKCGVTEKEAPVLYEFEKQIGLPLEKINSETILPDRDHKYYEIDENGHVTKIQIGLSEAFLLHSLPENINLLTNLETLILSGGCPRGTIPESISQLKSLKYLDASFSYLEIIPEPFCNISSLETLKLGWNRIQEVTDSIGKLSSLKSLTLHNNKILRLPNSIGKLRNLEYLGLMDNPLEYLPNSIIQLESLEFLEVYDNEMVNIPNHIKTFINKVNDEYWKNVYSDINKTYECPYCHSTKTPIFISYFPSVRVRCVDCGTDGIEKEFVKKISKDFVVNKYLTLRLEEGETNIYVNNEYFNQCKFLLLDIPINEITELDTIESIDEAAEILGWTEDGQENRPSEVDISPETEFWAHCSVRHEAVWLNAET